MPDPDPKHPEAAEFIRWLYERSGAQTVGDFAELVGEPERKIYRWLAGENAPRFSSAVKMMRTAGVLDSDAPLPQTVSAELAELRASLEQRLDALQAEIGQLDPALEPPPSRQPAATRRAGSGSP